MMLPVQKRECNVTTFPYRPSVEQFSLLVVTLFHEHICQVVGIKPGSLVPGKRTCRPSRGTGGSRGRPDYPSFPSIHPKDLELGQSCRVLILFVVG